MEVDYPRIKEVYQEANRYLHPSNFYCLGVELDSEAKKWLYDSQSEALVAHTAKLSSKAERDWLYNMMDIVNGILLEVMDKVVDLVEPPIEVKGKIDLTNLI